MSSNKQKPRRLVFRERIVFRTTSETLRLAEPDIILNNNNNAVINNLSTRKKPASSSSFQVTNVSHGPSGAGADSAEDESHSHSDDISRITDIETPSYSEDTFSKDTEDVELNTSAQCQSEINHYSDGAYSFGPSGSTYSYSCNEADEDDSEVASQVCSKTVESKQKKELSLSDSISQLQSLAITAPSQDKFIGRFQVVKVESLAPFRRGRWVCHDYLDNSKHAPKDGYTYYNGRYLSAAEFKKVKPPESKAEDASVPATFPAVLYICACLPGPIASSKADITQSHSSAIPTITLQGPYSGYSVASTTHEHISNVPSSALQTNTSQNVVGVQHIYSHAGILQSSPATFQHMHSHHVYTAPNLPTTVTFGQLIPQEVLTTMRQNELLLQGSNASPPAEVAGNATVPMVLPSDQMPSNDTTQQTSISMKSELVRYECDAYFQQIFDRDFTRKIFLNYLAQLQINVSSCTSAAIDSKIEQAMDIVRSNLMNKLRDEVIALRQNLADLNARIEQLETENQFLRKNAEPQTIVALESLLAKKDRVEKVQKPVPAIEDKPLTPPPASD